MRITVKRLIDIALAVFLLTISLPVMAVAAVAIKLDTPGPVVFRQTRIGRHGRPFTIFKLRSMTVRGNSEPSCFDSDHTQRITQTGWILRSTFIDELPQFLNVIIGDMSLVGPRPEMPHVVKGYTTLEKRRLTVKPGITGLWQISDCRGEPIHRNLKYDLFYVRNQSLALDAWVLFATLVLVLDFRRIGANSRSAPVGRSRYRGPRNRVGIRESIRAGVENIVHLATPGDAPSTAEKVSDDRF